MTAGKLISRKICKCKSLVNSILSYVKFKKISFTVVILKYSVKQCIEAKDSRGQGGANVRWGTDGIREVAVSSNIRVQGQTSIIGKIVRQ